MHVSGYYGNLNHSDDVYSADGTEKAKGVVVTTLVLPKTPEHEEQFHENHHERYQTCEQNAVNALHVP